MKNVALSQAKGGEIGAKISHCLGTLSTIDDQKLFQVLRNHLLTSLQFPELSS